MRICFAFVLLFSFVYESRSLSDKTSTCDEIILQQYNVNPTSCSSKFTVSPSSFSYITDEPIHITINTRTLDITFIGVHLSAQDETKTEVGNWKTINESFDRTSCGDLMANFEVEKSSINVIWQASSKVIGNIIIKVTIIENDKTIYINCYNIILTPRIDNKESELPPAVPSTTTTAITSVVTTTLTASNTTMTASPTAEVTVNVTWTFDTDTSNTNILMTVNNLQSGQWAALGLGQDQAMGEAHVFMCKRLANDTIIINRYMNPGKHEPPEAAGSEQGGVLIPGTQQFSEGVVICQFNLSNFTTKNSEQYLEMLRPLSQSGQYHPLFAIGLLDSDHEPKKHAKDSRTAKSDLVQLNRNEIILYKVKVTADDLTYVQTHGIIMIFTWILIVSTGALISRYFKNSWVNTLICGKAAWFAAHRFLMSVAAVLTMLGFLFILIFLQGTWIDRGLTRPFAHSIAGVLVISLAFFQPFIALFRCEPDSRYRFIFNYIHAFIGFSAFILSIATLFLATYFHIFKDNRGRIIMIVWSAWVALIFIVFEVIQSYDRKKTTGTGYTNINTSSSTLAGLVENPTSPNITLTRFDNEQHATVEQKLKNVLLAVHILVAATISVLLTTLII